MGNACLRDLSAEEKRQRIRNDQINQMIKEEAKKSPFEVTMLLLGSGESGKSTLAKQMKLIHMKGWTPEEKRNFTPYVYINVLRPMQILLSVAEKQNSQLTEENQTYAIEIKGLNVNKNVIYNEDTAKKVKSLFRDEGIQKIIEIAAKNGLGDSALYFLNDCERFADTNYIPTETDILRIRMKTTGIIETKFAVKRNLFRLIDVGGQRNERKKWIHCFEGVNVVMFVVALSDYDLTLEEDDKTPRMHESLTLFEEIINNLWFYEKPIILFLNKKDIFAEKIKKYDLNTCFPNYEGGLDYDNASKYIKKKLLKENKNKTRSVYVHFTCATDTSNVKFVFGACEDAIMSDIISKINPNFE